MSVATGKGVGMCLAFMFGFMALFMGLMFTFIFPNFDPMFEIISSVTLYGGILLVIVGIALIPGVRRNSAITRSIIEIAAVRKEVTISEISQETGLDREYVREILTKYLMGGVLFGYIEGDLFVRDTAGRPRYGQGQMGLGGFSD
ncbi:MAG: hypothetical protein ACTSWA_12900 [Candidatus Thorarchaeota archaeon]